MDNPNGPSNDVLLDIYRRATRAKQNDDKISNAIKAGKIVTIYYSPRGQEIIPAAVSNLLSDADSIVTIYRGAHDQIAKGIPLTSLWAEYAGRSTGPCKGKGGPMHITYPEKGIMVTTGVVGASMPIANGLALAAQLDGTDNVTVAYFGDGAANIGAFHESLNMASLWKLPVIFICQNNLYAEHTAYRVGTAIDRIAKRSDSYDMPGITVDGNDPVEMWRAAKTAIDRARRGEGPTLIEALTFRFRGHLLGDMDAYIPPAEKAAAMAKDTVPALRAKLIADGAATEDELLQIERDIDAEIDRAMEFALASPYPELAELRRDIFATEVPHGH